MRDRLCPCSRHIITACYAVRIHCPLQILHAGQPRHALGVQVRQDARDLVLVHERQLFQQTRLDPRLMYALANGRLYIPQDCTFVQLEAIVAAYRERLNATRKDDAYE